MRLCVHCGKPRSKTSSSLCRECFLDKSVRAVTPQKPNSRFKDLVGQVFGRLTVCSPSGIDKFGKRKWVCKCECGNESTVATGALTTGNTTSCGCWKLQVTGDSHRTHGMSKTPEYRIWSLMRNRCGDPGNRDYANYGGRGVTVDPRWQESFDAFFADVGLRPDPKYSLDRIDNAKGYEPGNVQWASQKTQCRNTRVNHLVTCGGVTLTVAEWSDRTGIPHRTIFRRLKRGMPPEIALAKTVRKNIANPTANDEARRLRLTWWAMCRRCNDPTNSDFATYGGRGINVCDRWQGDDGYLNFSADMGKRPTPKHSLERIDRDGPYSPENCRWATGTEQARNTSRNRFLTHNGETLCVSEWAERLGMPAYVISMRLNKHKWTVSRTLSTPIRVRSKR
jgi:hypothetical protein